MIGTNPNFVRNLLSRNLGHHLGLGIIISPGGMNKRKLNYTSEAIPRYEEFPLVSRIQNRSDNTLQPEEFDMVFPE